MYAYLSSVFLQYVCVCVCVLNVGLWEDPINWWWRVGVTGLEATPIVKQLSGAKSVCARPV